MGLVRFPGNYPREPNRGAPSTVAPPALEGRAIGCARRTWPGVRLAAAARRPGGIVLTLRLAAALRRKGRPGGLSLPPAAPWRRCRPAGLCLASCGRRIAVGNAGTACRSGGRPYRHVSQWYGVTDELLHVPEVRPLVKAAERHGQAMGACPGSPADAVDIALRVVRQVIVHHVADGGYIDAARGDVRGYQHPRRASAEVVERPLAGRLGLVAVERLGLDAVLAQLLHDLVRSMLGPCEDQCTLHLAGSQ